MSTPSGMEQEWNGEVLQVGSGSLISLENFDRLKPGP